MIFESFVWFYLAIACAVFGGVMTDGPLRDAPIAAVVSLFWPASFALGAWWRWRDRGEPPLSWECHGCEPLLRVRTWTRIGQRWSQAAHAHRSPDCRGDAWSIVSRPRRVFWIVTGQ